MEHTEISWADNTFNPWEGCARVSAGCQNCYAETRDKRFTGGRLWGAHADRRVTSDAYWRQPARWNRRAEASGVRERVFCASLADVFEEHADTATNDTLNATRQRLWELIEATPHLDWMLLTKRPENVNDMVPDHWVPTDEPYPCGPHGRERCGCDSGRWPDHVWIGTTVESPAVYDRLDHLRKIPARIRFVSAEPLLADLSDIDLTGISWVICGGESGPAARPMHPDWALNLRDVVTMTDCATCDGDGWKIIYNYANPPERETCPDCQGDHGRGVAFHFKQWGEWEATPNSAQIALSPTGVQKLPALGLLADEWMSKVGKKAAGRLLDGRTWDEVPQ